MPGALRVLLVEDNETDRWFLSEILRSRGNLVVACGSGEDALATLADGMPELVLLDLQLPGIDGLEVCRRLRARDDGHLPFVIMVTSTREDGALDEVLTAGADDFLPKPIQASTMVTRLDIAERRILDGRSLRSAESALVSKSREIETLFNNIQDVFFSIDVTANRLIQLSPATKALFGREAEELTGPSQEWRQYVLPNHNPWEGTAGSPSEGSFVREYRVDVDTGETKWIRASVRVLQDEEGGSLRADGLLVDVTQEIEARGELAERNRELETLHRLAELSLSAGSLEEAYAQILELVSEAMRCDVVAVEHLDRDRDRLVMTAAKGVPGAETGTVEVSLHRTLSGLAIRSGQPVLQQDPGSRSEYTDETLLGLNLKSFAAFPLMVAGSANGTLMLGSREPIPLDERFARLGSSLATTVATYVERFEAEEAIRESEMRHRALATQLQQANQELESFAYSVSHDLRAPLRTMQGFAHALIQNFGHELSAEARDYARRIIASGQQSEKLIRDLLAYSRLSFERLELMPVELKAVVEQAREQVLADMEESKAHLTVEGPLPAVRGNLTTLVQVVANLLSNAVKFVPDDRKPEVRIRTEERPGSRVRLWVEDNGVGIPVGQEERVFRVFERLAESGNRPGTGIGLAIVRRGLQRIDGECGVERLPEGGSGFWIEIPGAPRATWRSARRPR